MNKTLGFLLCGVLLSGAAWSQEKHALVMSGEGSKGEYPQQLAIDSDDVPGHQVRVYEIHKTYSSGNQPVIDGEHIVESWTRGFSDYIGGVGPTSGYSTLVTDKGNKIFIQYSGASESKPTETGSKRGTNHGTSHFVGGTGRFSKIRGTLVDSSKFDNDPKTGYNVGESRGEYWFEK